MTLATTMTYCAPQEKTAHGMAGILHWQHSSGGTVHCLIRVTLKTGKPIVILSELRSSPENKSFLTKVTPAANAAYSIIKNQVSTIKPTEITWLAHAGPFSTADTLWTADIESFQNIHLTWNGHSFEETGNYSDYERISLDSPLLSSLELKPVKEVLRELDWRNWRDE